MLFDVESLGCFLGAHRLQQYIIKPDVSLVDGTFVNMYDAVLKQELWRLLLHFRGYTICRTKVKGSQAISVVIWFRCLRAAPGLNFEGDVRVSSRKSLGFRALGFRVLGLRVLGFGVLGFRV